MTEETVITCGRCGCENRGRHGPRIDNGVYLAGSWEESGWVGFTPARVRPLRPYVSGFEMHPVRSYYVCPRCLLDEERPPDERWKTITCGRCGRENRGRLDDCGRVTEWEEPDWMTCSPAEVERLDGAEVIVAVAVGFGGYACPGCQTAEERAELQAIVWEEIQTAGATG